MTTEDRRYLVRRAITWLVLEERAQEAVQQAETLLRTDPRDPVALDLLDWVEDVAPHAVERAKSLAPDLLLCSDFTALLGIRVREEVRTPMCLINATQRRDHSKSQLL